MVLGACSRGVELPLELGAGDLVLVVSTVDGRITPKVYPREAGVTLKVSSDADQPVYTWVLSASAQVGPLGQPLEAEALAGAVLRFASDIRDPDREEGGCDRCVAPTLTSPMVVHPGDSCPLPQFNRGAIWRSEGGKFTCRGASDSTLCRPGDAADDEAIEDMRRQLRIDRPGACTCPTPAPSASLANLEILPFAPAPNPLPLEHFAKNAAGQIAGFSRTGVLLYDPALGTSQTRRLQDFQVGTRTAIALRSGDFLLASDAFNTGSYDDPVYHRFSVGPQGLSEPELVRHDSVARPVRMRYLAGPEQDFPLYLIGSVLASLGLEPAIFACSDDRLACQQVNLTSCERGGVFDRVDDAILNSAGFGLAVAKLALYYKSPNPAGQPNPNPNDAWRCAQPEGPFVGPNEGQPAVSLQRFDTIGATGNRLMLCGTEKVAPCESARAIVLTGTATTSDPEWTVAYRGPPGASCQSFVSRPQGVGLVLSGARLIDFDPEGHVLHEGTVFEAYGSLDGFWALHPLEGDVVVARGTENRVFAATSSTAFTPIYGEAPRVRATYRAAVPQVGGGFIAFGETTGPVQVDALGQRSTILNDAPEGVGGAQIYAAVRDLGPATPSDLPVVLGGDKGGQPFLLRGHVTANGLTDVERIELPPDAVSVRELANIEGRILVGTLGTRLFELKDSLLTEISLAWDEPRTEDVERRPQDGIDGCSGAPVRLDRWRAVFGGEGVGWAAGADGTLFQVTPSTQGMRAERYGMPEGSLLLAGMAQCSAETLLGVRARTADTGAGEFVRLRLLGLGGQDEPRRGTAPGPELDPRRQSFEPVDAFEFDALNIYDIVFGYPVAVLPDSDLNGNPSRALVLTNGYLFRSGAGRTRAEYLRVPFSPEFAVQDEAGTILFGGAEGRLAVGAPTIGQSGR